MVSSPAQPRTTDGPPAEDLEHVLRHVGELWEDLRGARLFVTGGTGFVGRWLLESLFSADEKLGLGVRVVALTRSPERFRRAAPGLARRHGLEVVAGDVRTLDPLRAEFAYVIHAAAETSAAANREDPLLTIDSIVTGTRRALELARQAHARSFLLTSSGAVYGPQPRDVPRVTEDHRGGPDPLGPLAAYAEGKRLAEQLCAAYQRSHGVATKIARCFAFVGPYLPLDAHFAVGNFIRDGLSGGPIRITGDGTPRRSYLHAADLAVWLWTILLRGLPARAYNVGSEDDLSIADLARKVADRFGVAVTQARAADPRRSAERYVPSTDRARAELGLRTVIDLDDALDRTIRWAS